MTGRPKKEISVEDLERLCAMQCADEEIAAWFTCSTKTIQRIRKQEPYKTVFENGSAMGRVSIKRAQYQAALKGNVSMLIWLGKVILGQKEVIQNQLTGEDGNPIAVAKVDKETYRRAREEILKEY